MCEEFSMLCLDSSSKLRLRVQGSGLVEMKDFALTAPMLLSSRWIVFTEMVLQPGITKDKILTQFSALKETLKPFLAAHDQIEATMAKRRWKQYQNRLPKINEGIKPSSETTKRALFHSPPDDALWAALLQQVAAKAAAAAKAAKHGLTSTFLDLFHGGTHGYNVAFAKVVAADERIRLLLLEQQDSYAGSQPVFFFSGALFSPSVKQESVTETSLHSAPDIVQSKAITEK
ncbi:hypothetical protein cyc_03781 [Cyclospora cayetanensis]|uniref:Uncharacterized protein n=1 Tax=Cyclospora cayetanensis TaxID=88456 RepID=A0A1D3D1K9_9EIME|nr:hypothetical protein cyc_03781 [Cyclospora cayetanensis]